MQIKFRFVFVAGACLLAACTLLAENNFANRASPDDAPYDAAAYLVAHHASRLGDVEAAARFYAGASAIDPGNTGLLRMSFRALYLSGDIEAAAKIAKNHAAAMPFPGGYEPLAAIAASRRDWKALARHADSMKRDSPALGGLFAGWAKAFTEKTATPDFDAGPGLGRSELAAQKALRAEYLGKGDEAVAFARIAIAALQSGDATRNSRLIMAGVLARQGATGEAIAVLRASLDRRFARDAIIAAIENGTSPLLVPPDEATLLAHAALAVSLILRADESELFPARGASLTSRILRLRLAAYLAPDMAAAQYHLAAILQRQGNPEWQVRIARIPTASAYYQPSRILAAGHHDTESPERAGAILAALIANDTQNPLLYGMAGDHAASRARYGEAVEFYDTALALVGDGGGGAHATAAAQLHYRKGIALDRMGEVKNTEAAFRASLAHDPDNPHTLNYLGYWLLENNGDYAEALGMIAKAVEARPDNGHFVDSLGWGYYRLERYAEALPHLERAVTLVPDNAIITDHLGDVYDKLGRVREAVYEWRRALYYADEETDREAINAKIADAEKRLARR